MGLLAETNHKGYDDLFFLQHPLASSPAISPAEIDKKNLARQSTFFFLH